MEKFIKENTIQLALSSIMFFSPLIKREIEKENIDIQKKKIINKYIKYGNINLILLIITISMGTLGYLIEVNVLTTIYKTFLWTLAGLIIIETGLIIKNLFDNKLNR